MILHIRIFEWNRTFSPTPESFWCCRIFVPGNCVGWFKIGSWTRFAVVWVCTSFWFVSCTFYLFISYCKLLFTSKKWCIFPSDSSPFPNHHPPITQKTHSFHVDLNILHQPRDIESAVSCCTIATRLDLLSTFAQQRGFLVGWTFGSRLGWWRSAGRQVGGDKGFRWIPWWEELD